MASIMPDARPLMPIAHWRNGKPPVLIVRMLKTQPFRQCYGMAFVEQTNRWFARFEAPDPLDGRSFW